MCSIKYFAMIIIGGSENLWFGIVFYGWGLIFKECSENIREQEQELNENK